MGRISYCTYSHNTVLAGVSPKAWSVKCYLPPGPADRTWAPNPDDPHFIQDSMCRDDEICVDGAMNWMASYARCVSQNYYITLITKGTKPSTAFIVESAIHSKSGQKYGFEDTLTNDDTSQVIVADNMEIQPHRADRSPIGKSETCSHCASIDVNTVPEGTTHHKELSLR